MGLISAQDRLASFGGSGSTTIQATATDSAGNIYVAGTTSSSDFPVRNAAQAEFGDALIMRSSDRGATWTKAGTPDRAVTVVVPDPVNRGTVFAAGGNGIFKSVDGGKTWRDVYRAAMPSYLAIQSLAIDPANPKQLAASVPQKGIVLSRDGGETWLEGAFDCPYGSCEGQLWSGPGLLVTSWRISRDWGRTSQEFSGGAVVAVHPTRPGWIYVANSHGTLGLLRVTIDYGRTWFNLKTPDVRFSMLYSLVIDPDKPDTMYVGTIEGLWRSTDGGWAWVPVNGALGYSTPDSSELAILPQTCSGGGIFGVAGAAGVAISLDGGSKWTTSSAPAWVDSLAAGACDLYVIRPITTDAFVSKLDGSGTALWATFLGGMNRDQARSLAIDPSGNVYVAGATSSADFPATLRIGESGNAEGFVTKLSGDGRIVWSATLGGDVSAAAVDPGGNVFVVGRTRSPVFPITDGAIGRVFRDINGVGEGYLMKLSPDGRIDYSTFLGTGNEGLQSPVAVAVNGGGEAIIAVWGFDDDRTYDGSSTLVRVNSTGSAYIARAAVEKIPSALTFAPDGSLWAAVGSYTTYVPGLSALGCSYTFPGPGARADQFDPSTLERRKSLLIGQACTAGTGDLRIDEQGTVTLALVAGAGFPLKSPMMGPPCWNGGSAVARLRADGSLLFSTFLICGGAPPITFALDGRLLASVTESQAATVLALNPNPSPAISLDRITNAFSGDDAGLAPLGLYALYVAGMNAESRDLGLNAAELPESLSDVQVTLDGVPARILQTGGERVVVVAPAKFESLTTTVQVRFHDAVSNSVIVPVSGRPGVLTRAFPALPDGNADANVRNEDGTLNGPDNPAARGSTVRLYTTAIRSGNAWSTWNYNNPETVLPIAAFASGISEIIVKVPSDLTVDENGRAAVAVTTAPPTTAWLARVTTFSNYVYVYVR